MQVQMLLAVLLPILVRALSPHLDSFISRWRFGSYASRQITYSKQANKPWWASAEDAEQVGNATIQAAILAYVNKSMPGVVESWTNCRITGHKDDRPAKGIATYSHVSFMRAPSDTEWVYLGGGIWLSRYVEDGTSHKVGDTSSSGSGSVTIKLMLRTALDRACALDAFIEKCVAAYNAELIEKVDQVFPSAPVFDCCSWLFPS